MQRRTRWGSLAMMFVVLAGCRREETPGPSAAAPPSPAPEARVAAPPPAADLHVDVPLPAPAGEILVDVVETPVGATIPEYKQLPLRVDAEGLRRLLPPRPGVPVPLAQVMLGKPIEEALIAGTTPSKGPLPNDPYRDWWPPPGHPGTFVTLSIAHFDDGEGHTENWPTSALVLLPRADARRLVTSVWGEPSGKTGDKGDIPVWIDEAGGFQARLVPSDEDARLSVLSVFPYLTLDRLVGAAPDRFGFEPSPYLGKTVAEVLALAPPEHHPRRDTFGVSLELPSVELDDTHGSVTVSLQEEEGRIESIMVFVPYALRARAEALVARKGPGFHVEDGGSFLRLRHE